MTSDRKLETSTVGVADLSRGRTNNRLWSIASLNFNNGTSLCLFKIN